MPIPGLDHEKCQQRNRIAARHGFSALPIRFLRSEDFSSDFSSEAVQPTEGQFSEGQFSGGGANGGGRIQPLCSEAQALAKINALRPGQEPLTADDVYIHYVEAANDNFISDRFAFLGDSTLKNIVRDANAGFAFMNSHRTGGLSHSAELPFGKTFIGRYEKGDGTPGSERALLGVYMLRGIAPNGQGGPTTDDLHRMIDGGTLFDVSVGLYGGSAVCDVCGEDLDAFDPDDGWLCPHVPGTTRQMTAAEISAQKARGVPGGEASYTLMDAGCGEVSGVFDGAVPSAGFRKTLALARAGALDKTASAQARNAYSQLLSKGELSQMDENKIVSAIQNGFASLGVRLGFQESPPPAQRPAPAQTSNDNAHGHGHDNTAPTLAALPPEVALRMNEQQEQLERQKAELEQLRRDAEERERLSVEREKQTQLSAAETWVDAQVKAFKVTPAAADHLKELAKEHPAAFAVTQKAIDANPVITALAGNGDSSAVVAGTSVAGGGDAQTAGARLDQLAKEYVNANPGTSYGDAFSSVCSQNKDLARAYRAAVTEGGN